MTKIIGVLDIVPGWVYALIIATLFVASCTESQGHKLAIANANTQIEQANAKASKAEADLAKYRGEAEAAARTASEAARTRETTLQKQADAARKADQNEITRIAAQRDAALSELRKRPARPAATGPAASGVPTVAGAGSDPAGCTGAQLYREDGSFLVGESARAEKLRTLLKSCREAYDRARSETPSEVTTDATEPSH